MHERTDSRTPLGMLGAALLHLLLLCLITAAAFAVQLGFSIDTGETQSGGLLSSDVYEIHPILFPLGAVCAVIGYVCVWRSLLRHDLQGLWQQRIGWRVFFVLLWLLTLAAILVLYLIIWLWACGLFSALRPAFAESFIIWYLCAAAVYSVVDAVLLLRKCADN